ncbi:UNVERIFIED_CONTAM: hypothetical protein K2H54_028560 [Gekko kuhli]
MAVATASILEFLPSSPKVTGARAPADQQPEQVPLQGATAGNSGGAGSANRDVPAGPHPPTLSHVVQHGAAETIAGKGEHGKSGARKNNGPRKKGTKTAATGAAGTTQNRRGKQGLARDPDYFEDMVREEWANPGGGTSLLSLARRFYSLPESIMEDLKVPLIDAPVVALHSGAVIPKDGENALKDAFDRKNENALKKAHEAMSLAIRSVATLSNFTRATAIWADNLLQDPEERIHMYLYLDDILIWARDHQTALSSTQKARGFLSVHGFLINEEKSQLIPTQDLVHLGARLNTVHTTVSLPEEKKIRTLVMDIRSRDQVNLMRGT